MMGVLQGVVMEIEDTSLPLVKGKLSRAIKVEAYAMDRSPSRCGTHG